MNICEHLTVTARLLPEQVAMVFEGQSFSYQQLDELSAGAAQQLCNAGIQRGDRVAIMLPNTPSFAVWYYAVLRLGAIAVSVSTRLARQEVEFVATDCQAKAFVADSSVVQAMNETLPDCVTGVFTASVLGDLCNGQPVASDSAEREWVSTEPNDPALILYTSGTTGFPKGATLSHMNVRSNVHAFNHLCNMQSHDRVLLAVPLFHCFGQNALLNSVFNIGGAIVLQRKFDPLESKQLIAEHSVTQLYGVPTMFQLLHDCCQPQDLASVNYCFSAAATLPIQVSQRWQEKFQLPINEGYGLTETSPFASYNHRYRFTPGSIGTPIDCVEMKIVDTESGEPQPPGKLGEIAIRGPNVMLGYWNRPGDTEHAIRDGWFYSGDIGRVDENGFYYIVDRVKDMIAVGGLKVFPAEVERVLLDHPAVAQTAVVGIADEVFGEQVVAFVVLIEAEDRQRDRATVMADIGAYARERLANYKVPRRVVVIDELPRNPSGKVLKTELRQFDFANASHESTLESGAGTGGGTMPEPMLRKTLLSTHASERQRVAGKFLQDLVAQVGGLPEAPPVDSRFLDAGLDSLMIVEVSHRLESEIGASGAVPATLVFDHPRICDLASWLVETLCPTDDAAKTTETPSASTKDRLLQDEIQAMSEEEALAELMKELEP